MLLLASCETQMHTTEFKNSFVPGTVLDFDIEQSANGQGNGFTIKMTTPGVYGYWDYGVGTKQTDEVSFIYPIPGEATFTYHILNTYSPDGGATVERGFSQSITVTINELDNELDPEYYALTGADLGGKVWKLNGAVGDGGLWWFMSPNDNISTALNPWWNAGGDGVGLGNTDLAGTLEFNLDGGANMVKTADDGTVTNGAFALNTGLMKLSTSGTTVLGAVADAPNPITSFDIVELTEDRLVLYVQNLQTWGRADACGWTWVFVPAN